MIYVIVMVMVLPGFLQCSQLSVKKHTLRFVKGFARYKQMRRFIQHCVMHDCWMYWKLVSTGQFHQLKGDGTIIVRNHSSRQVSTHRLTDKLAHKG